MTKKTVFWFIIGVLVAIIVMLVGATFPIPVPSKLLSYTVVATVALIVGYLLGGRKSDKK